MNKKFVSLGTVLSRQEAKNVLGGGLQDCTVSYQCSASASVSCTGKVCGFTDDGGNPPQTNGVTCDTVETKCPGSN